MMGMYFLNKVSDWIAAEYEQEPAKNIARALSRVLSSSVHQDRLTQWRKGIGNLSREARSDQDSTTTTTRTTIEGTASAPPTERCFGGVCVNSKSQNHQG
mmetsp:Transcript_20312/g.49806  ORF Transcript_20312/g.49806 Transcript_20312/m.49806 type:complete len:100 (-) Transcript_20312:567-866(-)